MGGNSVLPRRARGKWDRMNPPVEGPGEDTMGDSRLLCHRNHRILKLRMTGPSLVAARLVNRRTWIQTPAESDSFSLLLSGLGASDVKVYFIRYKIFYHHLSLMRKGEETQNLEVLGPNPGTLSRYSRLKI